MDIQRKPKQKKSNNNLLQQQQQLNELSNNNTQPLITITQTTTTTSSTTKQHLLDTLRSSDFLRQVSDQSRFVGIQTVIERGEKELTVEKTLLLIAQAKRVGVINLVDKMKLKDLLFEQGCKATLDALGKFPGGNRLINSFRHEDRLLTKSSSKDVENVCHSFTTSGGYSLRIATRDHQLLATALCDMTRIQEYFNQPITTTTSTTHLIPPHHLITAVSYMDILNHTKTYQGLSKDTVLVLGTPNAGGNSIQSEALSFEVVQSLFGAKNVIPERAVKYDTSHCSIVDYVCEISSLRVGVSVTRALDLTWPGPHCTSKQDVMGLVERKLRGLDRARFHVIQDHAWLPCAQLLHIWVQSVEVLNIVKQCMAENPFQTTSHVLLTLCPELDHVVFGNLDRYEIADPAEFSTQRIELQKKDNRTFDNLILQQKKKSESLERARERLLVSATSSSGNNSPQQQQHHSNNNNKQQTEFV
jgi:hypothetical protein